MHCEHFERTGHAGIIISTLMQTVKSSRLNINSCIGRFAKVGLCTGEHLLASLVSVTYQVSSLVWQKHVKL